MKSALLLVDIQNDFCQGGALAVPNAEEIIPIVNQLQDQFEIVVATQDWHPKEHIGFYTNHPNHRAFDVIQLGDIEQCLWPEHCVQNTTGAALHADLILKPGAEIIRKGENPKVDSYSAFFDNARMRATGLEAYLHARQVEAVYVAGLATDYCIKFTCLDAVSLGFYTYCIIDACRGIDANPGDVDVAVVSMRTAGVDVVESTHIV